MRLLALALAFLFVFGGNAQAFCGFYVARADTTLLNHASKVVLARKDERTVLTMASDVRGDTKEFAIVIPVPTVIQREQIRIAETAPMDHLDAYTAPRLVEYWDEDPCARESPSAATKSQVQYMARPAPRRAEALGVTVEAAYTIGEYDIVILSARDSGGLLTWLNDNDYKVPHAAQPVVGSYIRQKVHFFLAKVNLERQATLGFTYLRPIQVTYDSPKFMLPIRLGTVNAEGAQELIVLALSARGRIETTNYRTARLASDVDVPLYVKQSFGDFYRTVFDRQVAAEGNRAVFLEYAWDMGWCDPCAADPLTIAELTGLGASWLGDATVASLSRGSGPRVFVTRLHLRYDHDHFPEDLILQETADRTNFQGRYVLRHPYQGSASCEAADRYRRELPQLFTRQARTLAELTGWDLSVIRQRMAETGQAMPQ